MSSGLLSLKWNNHKSTFFHVLSTIRSKESYCDVTLACDGRFYSLHKFVLSTCSEYFEEMFERTQCKHPVIVLKDINSEDLEALLNYMYVGEVNVVQEKLAGLIKAAECLKIKGLAVPDEDPMESKDNSSIDRERHKRSQRGEDSPRAKRRRRENSSDVSEEILSPVRSRPSARNREYHSSQNSKSAPVAPSEENEDGSREMHGLTDASEEAENSSINANRQTDSSSNKTNSSQSSSHKKEVVPEEVTLDDEHVKSEPLDLDNEDTGEGDQDNKDGLHHDLGFDASDTMGGADDDGNYVDVDPSMLGGGQPQSVEDVVAQAMPGSSGFQGNSFPLWEGDGSLSGFPSEGFSGDSSQARQMVALPPWMGGSLQDLPSSNMDTLSTMDQQQQELVTALLQTLDPVTLTTIEDGDSLTHSLVALGGGGGTNSNGAASSARDGDDSQDILHVYQCPCCSYATYDKDDLDVHACAEHPDSVYSCKDCSFTTDRWGKYSRHINKHVIADKTFSCSYCSYRTKTKGSYDSHMRTHTGEKPYACSYCPYRSSQRVHLKIHVRTHTGEKPFACPNCPYQATQNSSLKRHIQTQHPPTPRVSRRYNKYTAIMPPPAQPVSSSAAQLMLPAASAAMLCAKSPFQGYPLIQQTQAEQHLREMLQQQLQQFFSSAASSSSLQQLHRPQENNIVSEKSSLLLGSLEKKSPRLNNDLGKGGEGGVVTSPSDLTSLGVDVLQSASIPAEPEKAISTASNGKY